MECQEVRRNLGNFLKGEVQWFDLDTFLDHLGHCSACQERLEEERTLLELLDEGPAPLPEDFSVGVVAKIEEQLRPEPAPRFLPWLLAPRQRRAIPGLLMAFSATMIISTGNLVWAWDRLTQVFPALSPEKWTGPAPSGVSAADAVTWGQAVSEFFVGIWQYLANLF